ncbi:MAG: carboxypeptidase-like regulatory domain-containing protein [Saprospiraceae bacterium]
MLVVGTSVGTVTDFDGKYSVEVPAGSDQLEFSYAGYSSQTITLDASNVVNVKMAAGALLDEVVVVGYGTVKKSDLTGAVTAVGEEDLTKGLCFS